MYFFLKRSHTCYIIALAAHLAVHMEPDSISNVSLHAFIWCLLLPSGDSGPAAGSERLQLHTGVQRRGHSQGQRRDDDLFPHQRTLEELTPAEQRWLQFRLLNSGSTSGRRDSWLKRARSPHRFLLQAAGARAGTAETRFAPRRRGPTFPDPPLRPKMSYQCVKTDFTTCEVKVPKQTCAWRRVWICWGIRWTCRRTWAAPLLLASAFLLLKSFCKAHSWVWNQFNLNIHKCPCRYLSPSATQSLTEELQASPTRLNWQTYTTVSSAYKNTKDVNEELFLIFDIFYFDLNTKP